MEMSGSKTIAATRAEVWAALNNPDVLQACIPGCQSMEKTSDTEFVAKVVQKVGPVKATFTGEVALSDIVEGESYRISGKGKGGAAGGASGGALVTLTDEDGATVLTYEAEAKVTGKIAQLGSRLIDGFAKKMADQFFSRFQEEIEGPSEDSEDDKTIGEQIDDAIDTAKDTIGDITDKAEEVGRGAASAVAGAAGDVKDKIEKADPNKKGFLGRLFGG